MQIHDTAFIAPGAVVLGDVTIGENSGIWYNAVVRGDRDSIVIGRESNIQDNAVVHLGSGYRDGSHPDERLQDWEKLYHRCRSVGDTECGDSG